MKFLLCFGFLGVLNTEETLENLPDEIAEDAENINHYSDGIDFMKMQKSFQESLQHALKKRLSILTSPILN